MGTHPIFESDFDCLTVEMELLLTSNVATPSSGQGLIIGTQVANGKFLIEGLIPHPSKIEEGSEEEHFYGHSLEVHFRLIGGISLIGIWSTDDENPSSIKAFKRLKKEGIVKNDIVSVIFSDDKSVRGKRIKDSGDVQKVEIKNTPSGKWPTAIGKGFFSLSLNIPTENLDSEATGKNLKRAVKDQSENLEICVGGKFGSSEETIFANNTKNIPKEIEIEIFNASKITGSKTVSASKVISLNLRVAVLTILLPKTTFGEVIANIRDDILKSFSKRIDILLDDLTLELEGESNSTLISTSKLAKRVTYPLSGTAPISLYASEEAPPGEELDFIFSTSESSKLFSYPEGELNEDIEDEEISEIQPVKNVKKGGAGLSQAVLAVLVLIIAVLVSIILSHSK